MRNNSLLYVMNDINPEILKSAEPGRKRKITSAVRTVTVAVMLSVISLFAVVFIVRSNDNVAARVYLDVNPSFTFDVSKSGKILEVYAGNSDAYGILAEKRDLSDTGVTVGSVLNAIMESGYLSEERDTLLLSIECEDDELAEKLMTGFEDEARDFLLEKLPVGHAIMQSITENKRADSIVQKYNISKGAATFLIRLIGVKDEYTEAELASLDITTLRRLCEENGISTEHKITLSPADADDIARDAMTKKLDDVPEGTDVYGYANSGESGSWRVVVQGRKYIAVYDVGAEDGKIVKEKHAKYLGRPELFDAAVTGSGYSSGDIANYEYVKSEEWIWMYAAYPAPSESAVTHLLKTGNVDPDDYVTGLVRLHTTADGYLSVCVDVFTGEVISVEKENYTYSIDTLDAVIIAIKDAGLPLETPPFPDSCVMSGGVCSLEFSYGGNIYDYVLNAFTGEIISKE